MSPCHRVKLGKEKTRIQNNRIVDQWEVMIHLKLLLCNIVIIKSDKTKKKKKKKKSIVEFTQNNLVTSC